MCVPVLQTEQSETEAERADKAAKHVQLRRECTVQEEEKIK